MGWHVATLADGDAGTAQTVGLLRALVDAGRTHPAVRAAALDAVRGQVAADGETVAHAVLAWVRARVTFVRDPVDTELVRSPHLLLADLDTTGTIQADCDEIVTLYAAMVEALGFPVGFLVQGPSDGDYSHILALVDVGRGAPLPVDPTNPTAAVGWRPRAGREASAMRTLGEDFLQFSPDWTATPTEVINVPSNDAWWTALVSGVGSLAQATLPLAERYGMLQPVVGYSATGQPIYASSTLPISGAQAGYTAVTQPVLFGMSLPVLALVGAGAFLLLRTAGRARR